MQRRKVLFPEPDGPMRQRTSPRSTVRSMPRSTSSRPNVLRTCTALTMGSAMGSHPGGLGQRRRRLDTDPEDALSQTLDGGGGKRAGRSPGVVALDVVLADG